MCANHHLEFEARRFFIRFQPAVSLSFIAFLLLINDSLGWEVYLGIL
jgi:hypothetical protein